MAATTTKVIEIDDRDQRILVKCLNDVRNDCIDRGIPTEDLNRLLLMTIDAPTKKEKRKADREGR